MSDEKNNKPQNNKPHFKLWKILTRVAILLAVLVLLAYALMPYWLPESLLKDKIISDIKTKSNLRATIGSVSYSWSEGVVIKDLIIYSDENFGAKPMVKIPQMTSSFSPLKTMLTNRFDWIVLKNMQVNAKLNSEGQLNLAPIQKLKSDLEPDRVSIANSTFTLTLPETPNKLALHVTDMQIYQGKMKKLGHLTMSAMLNQPGNYAPVTMRLTGDELLSKNLLAEAEFHFSNIDLSQVPTLGLNIDKMQGKASGKFICQVKQNLQIDRFVLDIQASDFKVKSSARMNLPRIKKAQLAVEANVDAFAQQMQIKKAKLTIPGADLAGSADVNFSIFAGDPTGLTNLKCTGKVFPNQLRTLLQNKPTTENNFKITGPVTLAAQLKNSNTKLNLNLNLSCDKSEISAAKRVIKPADLPMQTELSLTINPQDDLLSIQKFNLQLAENSSTITGQISYSKIANIIEYSIYKTNISHPTADLIRALKTGEFRADFTLNNLSRFNWIAPDFFADKKLSGALKASATLTKSSNPQLAFSAVLNKKQAIQIGNIFHKPKDTPASFTGTFCISTTKQNNLLFQNFDLNFIPANDAWLAIRNARFSLDNCAIATANLNIEKVESISKFFPMLAVDNLKIKGACSSNIEIRLQNENLASKANFNLTKTSIAYKNSFNKPSQKKFDCTLKFIILSNLQTKKPEHLINVSANSDNSSFTFTTAQCSGRTFLENIILNARAKPSDLKIFFPQLKNYFQIDDHSGRCNLTLKTYPAKNNRFTFSIDTNTKYFKLSKPGLLNLRTENTKLSAKGAAKFSNNKLHILNSMIQTDIDNTKSSTQFACCFDIKNLSNFATAKITNAHQFFDSFKLENSSNFSMGFIAYTFPSTQSFIDKYHLVGKMKASTNVNYNKNILSISTSLNADNLSAVYKNQFAKTPDKDARLNLAFSTADNFKTVTIKAAKLKLDKSKISAVGKVTPSKFSTNQDNRFANINLKIKADFDLNSLSKLSGDLRQKFAPAGKLTTSALLATNSKTGKLNLTVSNNFKDASLIYNTQKIALKGKAIFILNEFSTNLFSQSYSKLPDDLITKFSTDQLEVKLGDDKLWVVADLKRNGSLNGTFDLIINKLDSKKLSDLVTSSLPSDFDNKQARQTSKSLANLLKNQLTDAKITGSIYAKNLQLWDPKVESYLHMELLTGKINISDSLLSFQSRGAIHGGTMKMICSVNFTDNIPQVVSSTDISGVAVSEDFQAQISQDFPGNNVKGFFDRKENVKYALADFIAGQLKPELPVVKIGQATMLAKNGTIIGKGAPDFLANIFPGLNLTEYHYDRMTGVTIFNSDGSADNEMICQGKYNIYIIGKTDIDRKINYTVGLILVRGASAQWHLDWKQGRVPMLKVSGTIKKGKLIDASTKVPWPDESLLEVFLENNVFYRGWINYKNDN